MTIIFFCENLKTGLSSIRHCLLAHLQKRINSVYFVPSVASIPENPYFQSTANGTEDSAGEGKLSSWIAPESLAYCISLPFHCTSLCVYCLLLQIDFVTRRYDAFVSVYLNCQSAFLCNCAKMFFVRCDRFLCIVPRFSNLISLSEYCASSCICASSRSASLSIYCVSASLNCISQSVY